MLVEKKNSGIQPINSRFIKDQLQQNRDQLQQRTLPGIRVFCIDFISIGRFLSINTRELQSWTLNSTHMQNMAKKCFSANVPKVLINSQPCTVSIGTQFHLVCV